MAKYRLLFKRSAARELEKISKQQLKLVIKRIESLAENPRPPGCQKLSMEERYRVRQGNYRIVYSIEDKNLLVWIVKVANRKGVYR